MCIDGTDHHAGGVGKIACDGCEVKRGNRGDESFQGPVAEQVEGGGGVL